MLGFAVFAPIIDVFAKLAGQDDIAIMQIAAWRFGVQLICLIPIAILTKQCRMPNRAEIGLNILRGGLILGATGTFFAAIKYMPIADALAIVFIEPFILTFLGVFILREQIGWRRVVACIVGFFGAVLAIQPQYEILGAIAALPIGTALCFAFYLLLTRHMTQKTHPITVQLYTACAALVIICPVLMIMNDQNIAVLDSVPLNGGQILLLIGVGIAATIAHMFITYAFALAPVGVLAPLQYLEIVAATLFGLWIFDDFPNSTTITGIGIIVSAGLYVLMREHKTNSPTP